MLKNLRLSSDPVRSYHPSGTVHTHEYTVGCDLHELYTNRTTVQVGIPTRLPERYNLNLAIKTY